MLSCDLSSAAFALAVEEIKKQILGVKDWDASKKGCALKRLKGENLELSTGLPDNVLQAALADDLCAGGCRFLLCSDWSNSLPYLGCVRNWPKQHRIAQRFFRSQLSLHSCHPVSARLSFQQCWA